MRIYSNWNVCRLYNTLQIESKTMKNKKLVRYQLNFHFTNENYTNRNVCNALQIESKHFN